ncbi:MAG: HK97 family phage prohead protease [Streptococcus parasanguinis]|nr:HK97 family phage prohead protease [Streptococcus parasanguinis]
MDKHPKYDFAGYVTRNDMRCTDGVVIRHGAFRENDGKKVPLVWSHDPSTPENVIGHVLLHHADEGVYGQGYFNNTPNAQNAKELVQHGDIWSMSIGANRIKRTPNNDVIHGNIYEVSLVVAGANPGAVITEVLTHSDNPDEGERIIMESDQLLHSANDVLLGQERVSLFDRIQHADDDQAADIMDGVLATLNEDQQEAVAILTEASVNEALENMEQTMNKEFDQAVDARVTEVLNELAESDDDEEETEEASDDNIEQSALGGQTMHYNAFEQSAPNRDEEIRHSLTSALEAAQKSGRTVGQVLSEMENGDVLQHSMNNIELLFPDHQLQNGVQVIYSPNTATEHILSRVTKVPTAFVKSIMTDLSDLTDEQLRAKGYIKGTEKKEQILSFLSRKTDPQTIYKKQSIDRDDAIDIGQQLNVAAFFNQEMRIKLNDEIAQAILVSDGRTTGDANKIKEDRIRPITKDDDFYTIKATYNPNMLLDIFQTVAEQKTKMLGSGMPSLYINPLFLTKLRFLRNKNEQWVFGGQQPATKEYLASLFGVAEIVETNFLKPEELIMVNLADYQIGTNRGGEVNTFEHFDIDYNKQKYLIETRLSGALTRAKAAVYFKPAAGAAAGPEAARAGVPGG